MIRKLLWILMVVGLAALVERILRRVRTRPATQRPAVPRFEGAMVRDRVCRTFLLRSKALTLRCGGEEHFFCSESCKASFLTAHNRARAS